MEVEREKNTSKSENSSGTQTIKKHTNIKADRSFIFNISNISMLH